MLTQIRRTAFIAFVALVVFASTSCKKEKPKPRPRSSSTPSVQAKPKKPTAKYGDIDNPYKYELAGMDTLVRPDGVRRKVLIVRDGVRCRQQPGSGSYSGHSAKYYKPYFVFDVWPENAKEGEVEAFCIGPEPRKDSIIGWIDSRDCVCWDTRVGAAYNGTPLLVFENRKDLEDYLQSGNPEKAIARTGLNTEFKPMPWPITEHHNYDLNGKSIELYQINFLGSFTEDADLSTTEYLPPNMTSRSNKSGLSDEQRGEIRDSVRHLDIVFVSDTTSSMTPYIEKVKTAMQNIVSEVTDLESRPDVAFRFVEYRDYVKGVYFDERTKRVYNEHPSDGTLVPAYNFLNLIRPIESAKVGSDGLPEAVFDGVNAALARTKWRGVLSHRVIILMGDDSSHPAGHARNPRRFTLDGLISHAIERGVKVFSLMAPCPGEASEVKLHSRQFTRLAERTGGKCYKLDEALKVVTYIDKILGTEGSIVADHNDAAREIAEVWGDLDRLPTEEEVTNEMPPEKVSVVLQFIKKMSNRGITPEMLADGQTAFCQGWIASEIGNSPQVERKIFIARKELSFLNRDLNIICEMLRESKETGGGVMKDVVKISWTTRVGEVFDALSIRNQEPEADISAYYSSIGVPERGMFNMSKSELLNMSTAEKNRILFRLSGTYMPRILNDLNDNSIFPFFGEGVKFGWIPEEHIP